MTKRVSDADKVVGVYHQLVELYTQWQSDRSTMDRRWQDFMKTDQAFHRAIENLEAITPGVKKSLSQSLNKLSSTVPEIRESLDEAIEALENVTPSVKKSLTETINHSFKQSQDQIVKNLHRKLDRELDGGINVLNRNIQWAGDAIKEVVAQSKRQFRWALWKTGIIAIISSLASSFVLCFWLAYSWIPSKIKPISYVDEYAMEEGLNLLGYYKFLTEKEKNMLKEWKHKGWLNRRGDYYPDQRKKVTAVNNQKTSGGKKST